jgi:uncharacterized protein YutE (UPF0331/DUF86 family)
VVDRDVVLAKLGELADRITRLRTLCPPTTDDLAADRDRADLVAFNLMLAVQSCLDIASHLIADEGWRAATTLAGAFQRLAEHGVLTKPTADALGKAAGLRNVVAHGYAAVALSLVHQGATAGLRDLETFAREVATWLGGRPAS